MHLKTKAQKLWYPVKWLKILNSRKSPGGRFSQTEKESFRLDALQTVLIESRIVTMKLSSIKTQIILSGKFPVVGYTKSYTAFTSKVKCLKSGVSNSSAVSLSTNQGS